MLIFSALLHWSHEATQSPSWQMKNGAWENCRDLASNLIAEWKKIFHFPHVSILWYIQIVVPVIKKIFDKNTLRFTTFIFPHCASSNGLHGRIHNHTDYVSTLLHSVFKCVLKMWTKILADCNVFAFLRFSKISSRQLQQEHK